MDKKLYEKCLKNQIPVVVKDIAIGAGGLGFESQACRIGHGVANGSPPPLRFFGDVSSYGEWRGRSPRLNAWATQLQRNITAVVRCWRRCVRFDRPEN